MALTPYIKDGRMVFFSDLVLAISVYDLDSDTFETFLEANRSRIHEDDIVTKWKTPIREERAKTEDTISCIVLLTFSHPPKQASPYFTLGRDPETCDVVFDSLSVSRQHIRFGFENGSLVIHDVSEMGSRLREEGRQFLWDRPTDWRLEPSRPKKPPLLKETLIYGWTYDLWIPGFHMQFKIEVRHGHEKLEYEKKRHAWLASSCASSRILATPTGDAAAESHQQAQHQPEEVAADYLPGFVSWTR